MSYRHPPRDLGSHGKTIAAGNRGHRPRPILAARFALAFLTSTVAPAEDDDVVTLSPLTVEDVRYIRNRTGEFDTLHEITPARHPGGASTLPTLASSLAGLPGVIAQDGFGGFDPPRLTLRGSGLQSAPVSRGVWWTLDDLPLNAVDGSFNSALIEPALAARVGVKRGTTDPRAAGTALGGALALFSPGPDEPAHAWCSAGEYGFRRAGVSAGGRAGAMAGWFGTTYAASDGWRRQSAQERFTAAGTLVTRPGRGGPLVTAGFFATNVRLEVPGPLTLTAARDDPTSISAIAEADRPRRETDFARVTLDATWRRDHAALDSTRVAFAAQHTNDWFRQLRANGTSETHGDDYTMLGETQHRGEAHTLRAGLLARAGFRAQQRWRNSNGATGARFADIDLEAGHAIAWIDDRWQFAPKFALTGGVAWVDATREARGTPNSIRGKVSEQTAAPHLALDWRTTDSTRVFVRLARAVEPPTFDDLLTVHGPPGNLTLAWTPLRVQLADTIEVGASGGHPAFAWECIAYEAAWTDELLRLADANGAARGTVNAGRTRHCGIETALRWSIVAQDGRTLDLALTHTWSRAIIDDGRSFDGHRLAGLPPHAGSARLAFTAGPGFFAGVGITWIGGTTWADHAGRLGYSGYTHVGARAGWRHHAGWTVFVEVDNAFDHAYIASTAGVTDLVRDPAATALFLPGAPRTIRAGMEWRR